MQTISIIFKSFTWSRIWYLLWMEDEIIDWSNLPAYLQCELLPIYMHTVGQNLVGEAPKLCKSNALFQIKVPLAFISGWKGVSSSGKQEFVDKNEKKGNASLKLNQDGDDALKSNCNLK